MPHGSVKWYQVMAARRVLQEKISSGGSILCLARRDRITFVPDPPYGSLAGEANVAYLWDENITTIFLSHRWLA